MGFLRNIWMGLKKLFQLIALPFSKVSGRAAWRTVRWTLHIILLIGVLVGLWFLAIFLGIDALVRVPFPLLRIIWLPLLFLLTYLLAWVGWWLWRLLSSKPEAASFPDIDSAWERGCTALEQAGIDLNRTPLFLILGRPASDELAIFGAARIPFVQPPIPKTAEAPLRIAASTEGIYVICSDSSLFNQYAAFLAQRSELAPLVPADTTPSSLPESSVDQETEDLLPPNEPSAQESQRAEQVRKTGELKNAAATLVEEESRNTSPTGVRREKIEPTASILQRADVIETTTARMRRLCQLIVRDRRPYCPINGILVLIPFEATETDVQANEAALVIQHDLNVITEELHVKCPVIAAVCDLETAEGSREFLERFPEQQRHRRLGIAFPHMADCDAELVPDMVDQGVSWICEGLVPQLAYRLVSAGSSPDAARQELQGNIQIYNFIQDLRNRQHQLARILRRGIVPQPPIRWELAGCYLAATGLDAPEQGFLTGIFVDLHERQNAVSWTPEALAADLTASRAAKLGYLGVGLTLAALFAVIWLL